MKASPLPRHHELTSMTLSPLESISRLKSPCNELSILTLDRPFARSLKRIITALTLGSRLVMFPCMS